MIVKRLTKRGIELYDDPNVITEAEYIILEKAKKDKEKADKDKKDALIKHLDDVSKGKTTMDTALFAEAILLIINPEPGNSLSISRK